MKRTIFITSLLAVLLSGANAQTWVKVANGGDTVAASAGAVLRYGANVSTYACDSGTNKAGSPSAAAWSAPLTLAADTTITDDSIFGPDPAYCVVKEIDVLETPVAQTVTVNGIAVNVPALPVSKNLPGSVIKAQWTGPVIPCYQQNVTAQNPDGSTGKTYSAQICGPID